MVKLTFKTDFKPIKIDFGQILLEIAERIIIPDIQQGIDAGMAIEGGALPANEAATIKKKGHNRQLIDTGALRSSPFARKVGPNKVRIALGNDRQDIGGYLQIEGIRTRHELKFYNFFGISRDAEDRAIAYMETQIEKAINA